MKSWKSLVTEKVFGDKKVSETKESEEKKNEKIVEGISNRRSVRKSKK